MSLLPTMGSLTATQDTNKQLSSIRSYLSQLQETTEAELMNIGMDNLSGELKKKFESMSDDIRLSNNNLNELQGYINANFVSTNYLEANYVTTGVLQAQIAAVNTLIAGKAEIGELDAAVARIGFIETNYITAETVRSNYVQSNYLSTNYLTSSQISTQYLKTGNFTASNISAKFSSSESAIFDRLNCRDFRIVQGNNTYQLSWKSVNSGGNTIYFLGTNTAPT